MGKRGPKKGAKYKPTLQKEAAREALRIIVTNHMEELVSAQIANAKGIRYLVGRNRKGGTFKRLDSEPLPGQEIGGDDEIIEVWHKDPSVHAFTDLMNRAIDKPKEQEQTLNLNLIDGLAERLHRGQERAKK